MSVGCPFKEQPISSHIRVQCLLFLEDTLRNFYVPFARQVNESYSDQEKKLLARIIRLLTFRMEGQLFEPCFSCKSVRHEFISFFCAQNYFRFTLSTECPFSITTRTKCLHELVIKLRCFFVCQIDRCSVRERKILSRVKRIFVHQLRGTSEYDLLKKKHKSQITKVEQQELRKQKKDEQRMKHISLYMYNPLSQKYRNKKKKLFQRMEKEK